MLKPNPYIPTEWADIENKVHQTIIDLGHPERADGWTHRNGGVETGATWRRAKDIYRSVGLRMRAIHSLAYDSLDLRSTFVRQPIALPISVGPMVAGINFVCKQPFREIAKAAARMNVAAGIGYPSAEVTMKEMSALCDHTFRIVKPLPKRERLIAELRRGLECGCCAVGIDIDSIAGMKPVGDELRFAEIARPYGKEELREVRKQVKAPFIIKGIMSEQDALDAVDIGADTLIVSTHVGYALDYSAAPLEVLPAIRRAVGDRAEILIDSGITRGTDIVKAVALGADGVLIGRLALWGLLLDDVNGVEYMLSRLENEIRRTMILMGVGSLKELGPQHLLPLDERGQRILDNL